MSSRKIFLVPSLVTILLIILLAVFNLFNGWIFFGMIFYSILYVLGLYYVKQKLIEQLNEEKFNEDNRKKFDWCFDRVNSILRRMSDGDYLEWRGGINRESFIKYFHDGIQQRTYRSIIGHMSNSQVFTLIIYDVDNDDISAFISNPSVDEIKNHFYNFKPFTSGRSSFGDPYLNPLSSRSKRRSSSANRRRGITINVDNDDYDGFDGDYMPKSETVNKALEGFNNNGGK